MPEEINVNLDTLILKEYLKKQDWSQILEYLFSKFETQAVKKGTPCRFKVNSTGLNCLCDILISSTNLKQNDPNKILHILRILRNCVSHSEAQNTIIKRKDLLQNINQILSNDYNKSVVKVSYQFLINLIVGNAETALIVYKAYENVLLECTRNPSNYYYYEVSALLYNLSLSVPNFNTYLQAEFYKNIIVLCEKNIESNTEYLQFLIENFIYYTEYWEVHADFPIEQRIVTLEFVRNIQIDNKLQDLPKNCLKELINKFSNCADVILKIAQKERDDLEPYEISLVLEIISSCCSNEAYLTFFQQFKDLVIVSCALLQNIHRIGSESNNCFSSIQKLSEINDPSKEIQNHHTFGFKVNLVRLVGNLCWKCKTIQDLAREAEVIPVILNCCNIDARNPFIMQWVILAVRNLCENNSENQNLIASLHRKGFISNEVLNDMGIKLPGIAKNTLK